MCTPVTPKQALSQFYVRLFLDISCGRVFVRFSREIGWAAFNETFISLFYKNVHDKITDYLEI